MHKLLLMLLWLVSLPLCAEPQNAQSPPQRAKATFSGGCFWCMEKPFDPLKGVLETVSGYTGGFVENPSYEAVSSGSTGHVEALQITYDPNKISYQQLLDVYWRNIDPTNDKGQFCDKGAQYRAKIFYHDEGQKRLAEQSKAGLEKDKPFSGPVTTTIEAFKVFYPAEDYHQNYYQKNPLMYKFYRYTCGRDQRLHELWGKP
ncbi:peptide-methionine (S)-S-oxide reductase MsrA [Methylosoma difficile]